jgi:hypothetical protein
MMAIRVAGVVLTVMAMVPIPPVVVPEVVATGGHAQETQKQDPDDSSFDLQRNSLLSA